MLDLEKSTLDGFNRIVDRIMRTANYRIENMALRLKWQIEEIELGEMKCLASVNTAIGTVGLPER